VASEGAAEGGFNLTVALLSTALALIAIALSYVVYVRRMKAMEELPLARRSDDPLRKMLGPIFTLLEHKYYVDELYNLIILQPYNAIAKFVADKVDWDFWHDFFHDKVLAGGFKGLTWLLSNPIDTKLIDGFANGLAEGTQELAQSVRRIQTGYVRNYALSVFAGLILIIGYLILRAL
jgi:NADH-quinone oxidoreductase subunit L